MSDSDKAFWQHMHKKPADKFNSCDGVFFPDSFVTVIFHIVSNGIFIHTDDAVVADGNPVRILAQISNDGLSSIKSFFAVRNPFFFVTYIQKFLKSIIVTIFFTGSMELKLVIFS